METIKIAQKLNRLLDEKFPGNYNYAPLLATILGIHEKTVRSKLRGDTQFTLAEAYKIAKKLDIPVGDIFNETGAGDKHPMEIYIHNFSLPWHENELVIQTLETYRLATASTNSKYLVASNTLPDYIFYEHEYIARFNYMKWLYFNRGREGTPSISEIEITAEDRAAHKRYGDYVAAFKRSVYILNIDMMRFMVEELLFFYRINLLSKEEVTAIAEAYRKVVQKLETICNRIVYSEDREIHIFFSRILLSNDITIIESDELNLAMIYANYHNPVVTTGVRTFKVFRQWFNSLLHSANIISVSDPIQRVDFFANQYDHLAALQEQL